MLPFVASDGYRRAFVAPSLHIRIEYSERQSWQPGVIPRLRRLSLALSDGAFAGPRIVLRFGCGATGRAV
jgi:hypothetical protein